MGQGSNKRYNPSYICFFLCFDSDFFSAVEDNFLMNITLTYVTLIIVHLIRARFACIYEACEGLNFVMRRGGWGGGGTCQKYGLNCVLSKRNMFFRSWGLIKILSPKWQNSSITGCEWG